MKVYTDVLAPDELEISWHIGAIPLEDETEIMRSVDAGYPQTLRSSERLFGECPDCRVYLYEAGLATAPARFAGAPLYYMYVPVSGMGIHYSQVLALYVEEQSKFLILSAENPEYIVSSAERSLVDLHWFAGMVKLDLDYVYEYPAQIYLEELDITVEHKMAYKKRQDGGLNLWISAGTNNSGGIVDVVEREVVTFGEDDDIVHRDPTYGPVFFDGQAYYIVMPDGAIHMYDMIPSILIEPDAEELFVQGGDLAPYGCGRHYVPLTGIVDGKEWFDESLLVKIGETSAGDAIYEMSNKAETQGEEGVHPYYNDLYGYGFNLSLVDEGYEWDEVYDDMAFADKYAKFVADYPVFFWKDQTGYWRVFHKAKFVPMAECGKPVVYLYPEEKTAVNVQVEPNGGFTKTDPLYPTGGWNVIAHPDGTLEYPKDGKTYPYLFWEGHANGFMFPEEGFVIAKEDVPGDMRELLYKTGLNYQETEDFMEFWEEYMTVSPYVFVTFVDQRYFEPAAPLTITPQPDTTIRVMMNFEPLDEWKEVAPLNIRTPKRDGYTVVEWGGVLQ